MSAFKFYSLRNTELDTKFFKMFKGAIYQLPSFGGIWIYETPKAKNEDHWLYFPESTTESRVEYLVKKSIKAGKDYVYKATKDTPTPESIKEYDKMIARGIVF